MKTSVEYAGHKIVQGKIGDRVTNFYNNAKQVEEEILESHFHDGETIGLVRREIHQFLETTFTATVKLDKRQV